MSKKVFRTKFVENLILYNLYNKYISDMSRKKRDISKKLIFTIFDLEYLRTITRDLMRYLRQPLEHQNKGLYTY